MGMNWVPQHMQHDHAHFQRFYKHSNGFLEQIFIWPFELNSLGDEDISTNVTPTSSPTTHTGPVTRARARQLNYQVLSFLTNPSNVHEHMMLSKLDTFVLLMNEGPSMDKKDGHWSGIKHGEGGARAGQNNGASSGDFRT